MRVSRLEADACGDRGPVAARAARLALAARGGHRRVDWHVSQRGPLEGAAYALDGLAFQNRHPGALERLKLDDEFLPALKMLRRMAQGRYLPVSGAKAVSSLAARFAPDSPGAKQCFAALDEWRREGLLAVTCDGRPLPPDRDLGALLRSHVAYAWPGRLDLETLPKLTEVGRQAAAAGLLQGDAVEVLLADAEARETPEAVSALTKVLQAAAGDPTTRTILEPYAGRLAQLVSRADARQTLGGSSLDVTPEAQYLEALHGVFPLDPASLRREVMPLLFTDAFGARARFDLARKCPGLAPEVLQRGLQVGLSRDHWNLLGDAVAAGEWLPSDDEIAWMVARLGTVPSRSDTDSAGAVEVLSKVRKRAPERVRIDGPAMLAALLEKPPSDAADKMFGLYNDVIVGDTYELIFPDAGLEADLLERLETAYAEAGSLGSLDLPGQAAMAVLASLVVHGIGTEDLQGRLTTMLQAEGWRGQRSRSAQWLGEMAREADVAASAGVPLAQRARDLEARATDASSETLVLQAWRERVRQAPEAEVEALAAERADRVLPGGTAFELAMLDALAVRLPAMRDRMMHELAPRVGKEALGAAGATVLQHARNRLQEGTLAPSEQAVALRVLEAYSESSSWAPSASRDWADARAAWEKGLTGWMTGLATLPGGDAWKALDVLVQAVAPREPGAEDLARLREVLDVVGDFPGACREYAKAAAFAVDGRSWVEAKTAAFRSAVYGAETGTGTIEERPDEVSIGGLTLPVRRSSS